MAEAGGEEEAKRTASHNSPPRTIVHRLRGEKKSASLWIVGGRGGRGGTEGEGVRFSREMVNLKIVLPELILIFRGTPKGGDETVCPVARGHAPRGVGRGAFLQSITVWTLFRRSA